MPAWNGFILSKSLFGFLRSDLYGRRRFINWYERGGDSVGEKIILMPPKNRRTSRAVRAIRKKEEGAAFIAKKPAVHEIRGVGAGQVYDR